MSAISNVSCVDLHLRLLDLNARKVSFVQLRTHTTPFGALCVPCLRISDLRIQLSVVVCVGMVHISESSKIRTVLNKLHLCSVFMAACCMHNSFCSHVSIPRHTK